MTYQPITAVWEITMGCNMRCKHCGSSCENPLPDELTTKEALDLVDQIADLGLKWITLSGGEPFTRKDWHLIAKRLREKGVVPNLISNGWLVTEDTIKKAKEANIGTIAISLDGLKETHDFIRKKGSFDRVMHALELFIKNDIACGVITTITKTNIEELPKLRTLLNDMKVPYWQVQIGLPMGNFIKQPDFVLDPEQMDDIIDFCFETAQQNKITIYPADCIGYYNIKELETRQISHNTSGYPIWQGCNAGKRGFGVLHNGEILGCTSIRDREFVEGSIRERSLREIWEDPNLFLWNRTISKAQLKGDCHLCKFGEDCLGGCPNTRLTMEKDLYGENKFCSYNVGIKQTRKLLEQENNIEKLMKDAQDYLRKEDYQIAELVYNRVLEIEPNNLEALQYHGFVNFYLKNYQRSVATNKKAVELNPEDVYSLKGLGISMFHNDKKEEGISYLKKAISLTDINFMDPYYDLALLYADNNQKQEAKELLEKAKEIDPNFCIENKELYDKIYS